MDNKLLLLGLIGLTGVFVAANLSNDDDDDYEEDNESNAVRNIFPVRESYYNPGTASVPPSITSGMTTQTSFPQQPRQQPIEQPMTSPLDFATMVENFENVHENYDDGGGHYPSYHDKLTTGYPLSVDDMQGSSLPVGDMTDTNVAENNKYIYDRTIGTIGFTSTKIGGRRRGQADYVRGDLAIIPDKNALFQVSADPINTLLKGALNSSSAIGSEKSGSSGGSTAQHAQRKAMSLDELSAKVQKHNDIVASNKKSKTSKGGALHAARDPGYNPQTSITLEDIFNAQKNDIKSDSSNLQFSPSTL